MPNHYRQAARIIDHQNAAARLATFARDRWALRRVAQGRAAEMSALARREYIEWRRNST